MKIELLNFNAIILETKLELTHILMKLHDGEKVDHKIVRLIETLEEIPYKNPSL